MSTINLTFQVITDNEDTLAWLTYSFKIFFASFGVEDTMNDTIFYDYITTKFSGYIATKYIQFNIDFNKNKQYKSFDITIKRLAPRVNTNCGIPIVASAPPRIPDCEEDTETKAFNDCVYMWSEYVQDHFKKLTYQYESSNWYQLHPDHEYNCIGDIEDK